MDNKQRCFPLYLWGSFILSLGFNLSSPVKVFSQETLSKKADFHQYLYPEDFHFRRLGVEEGLSNAVVSDIIQDQQGFIWIATADGLNRFDGYQFKAYKNIPGDSLSLSNNQVSSILEDREGFLWVGTSKGLNKFDPRTELFSPIYADTIQPKGLSDDNIRCLKQDKFGLIWIGTNRGGLNVFDPKTKVISHYLNNPDDPASLGDNCVQVIEEDSSNDLWLGTMGGLCFFDRKIGKFKTWAEDPENPNALSQNWVNAVMEDPEGYIWAGATHGLNRLDPATGLFQQFWPGKPRDFWLGPNGHRILSFYLDRSGNLWIGTQWGGLYRYDSCLDQFYKAIFNISDPHSLSDNVVNCIFQDREGTLWVGTGAGLNLLNPAPNPFRVFSHDPADTNSLKDVNVNAFLEEFPELLWIGTQSAGVMAAAPDFSHFKKYPLGDRNALGYIRWNPIFTSIAAGPAGNHWLGTMGSGFAQLDRETGQFKYRFFQPSNRNFILSVLKDREGELWYGSLGGLNHYHPDTEESDYFPFAPEDPLSRMTSAVNVIYEDSHKRLWVGTSMHGLKQFDRNTCEYLHFLFGSEDIHGTKSAAIAFIFEDREKQVWVGTSDAGFYRFNPGEGTFQLYSSRNGLPNDALSGMAEDSNGNLWIATGRGISKFNPKEGSFRNYDLDDGLPSNSFTSLYQGPYSGRIFLGTQGRGFGFFHPDSLGDNTFVPPVVISSLQRYRRQGAQMIAIEEKGVSAREKIRLSYRDNILNFEVAALSFRKTSKNQYAYLLEGFNDNWIQLGTKRNITFTNLDPGRYTLRVKASNGDGLWNEEGASLKIFIAPPWWATWWAYALYAVLGASAVFGLYRFQLTRKLAAAEAHRLKELDAVKTHFYTNITHEFRTPLTVISGMAGQIREDPERWTEEGTEMIRRNSDQLLSLVTQMLDLAKLESGSLPLKMQQGDILVYLKYLLESFHSLAESKQIDLIFETGLEELNMDYDPEKIQHIISNLMSNAIKFTPEGGIIKLSVALVEEPRQQLLVQVSDTGSGIPEDRLPFVFDRFYQVEESASRSAEGTGIGLALTKELVLLLEGQIRVESRVGEGSVFSITLPVTRGAPLKKGQPSAMKEEVAPFPSDETLPLVLIAEDNPDVVAYLSAFLEGQYRLEIAHNGQEGIEKGLELVPDLVISDVMMPEKDGFEVCQTLKTDVRTSHIPIILLTAKADIGSRLQGLEHGADVYLSKPFHKTELLVQLHRLLELRQKLQAHYLSLAGAGNIRELELGQKEENEFVLRIRRKVEEHLSDPSFSVDRLCRELAMSNSQLHRKLSSLTGYSPNHFIRFIRLCEAQRLLKGSDLTIAEAAYQVGFEDPGYFARAFKKEFGVTPKEWREE